MSDINAELRALDAARFEGTDEDDFSDVDVRVRENAQALLDGHFFAEKGLKLEKVLRLGRRQTRWFVDVRDLRTGELHENIELGRTQDVRVQERVRDAVQEVTGQSLPRVKAPKWDKFREALHAVAEVEDHGSTAIDEVKEWLASFLASSYPKTADLNDSEEMATLLGNTDGYGWPTPYSVFFASDGRLYLRLQNLLRHVTVILGARTTRGDLGAHLRLLGFKGGDEGQLSVRSGGKVFKARYWRSEPGFDPDALEGD